MKLYKCIFITLVYTALLPIKAQIETHEKYYSKTLLSEDYKIAYESIINYHPAPYFYINEKALSEYYIHQQNNLPDSLNELEFHLVVRELIAQIKCGHTYAKPSDSWYEYMKGKDVLLPFEIQHFNKTIYIAQTTNDTFDFKPGNELISINEVPIEEILKKVRSIQERDGYTLSYVDAAVIKKFRTYYLFLYGVQQQYLIHYRDSYGEIKQSMIKPSNKVISPTTLTLPPPCFQLMKETGWSKFYFDTVNKIGILKIGSFKDRKEHKKYYKEIFTQLKTNNCNSLILDLRDNGGGNFMHGYHLLTYFTKEKIEFNFKKSKRKIQKNEHTKLKKWGKLTSFAFALKPSKYHAKDFRIYTFTYYPNKKLSFHGKLNVLTNGITFSLGALVAGELKSQGATVFGVETGGGEKITNAILTYELVLPNTKIKVFIPHYQIFSNHQVNEYGYGVKPDYMISESITNQSDTVLTTSIKSLLQQ